MKFSFLRDPFILGKYIKVGGEKDTASQMTDWQVCKGREVVDGSHLEVKLLYRSEIMSIGVPRWFIQLSI